VRRVFAEELNRDLARHLSTWEVTAQNREMVAEYVTPPLLQKSATVLKTVIDPIREDAFAKELEKISDALVQTSIEKPQPAEASAPGIATAVAPTSVAPSPSVDDILKQKAQNDAYDVYICYHDEDEDEVFKIGEQLKARGILPWFDILARAGKLRRRQQEEQIEKIPAAAVFVGQHAVADWQVRQMYSFLEQFVERECAVIPVLLPDAPQKPKLPVFLANFGWVDFRKKVPEPMGQLIWGITGERPHV